VGRLRNGWRGGWRGVEEGGGCEACRVLIGNRGRCGIFWIVHLVIYWIVCSVFFLVKYLSIVNLLGLLCTAEMMYVTYPLLI
jgi:hypothetical protein